MSLNIGDKFKWLDEGIIYTIIDLDVTKRYGQYLVEWWSYGIWGEYSKKVMWDSTVADMDKNLADGIIVMVYKADWIGPLGSIKEFKILNKIDSIY